MTYATADIRERARRAISPDDARLIRQLRLLVARAAAPDSLGWWDDEALTEPAAFILDRLFPVSPALIARRLAVRAALARHAAAADFFADALHLFRLDWRDADALAMDETELMDAPLDLSAVPSIDAYRRRLAELTGERPAYRIARESINGGLVIDPPRAPVHVNDWLHRATVLAWVYLEGQPGRTVIPLIIEH